MQRPSGDDIATWWDVGIGNFSRTFAIPEALPAQAIKSKYENGVLEIRYPKPADLSGSELEQVVDEAAVRDVPREGEAVSRLAETADAHIRESADARATLGVPPDALAAAEVPSGAVKVTVKLPEDLASALRSLAAGEGKTFTQELKEAISLKLYVEKLLREGAKLLVEPTDGKHVRELVFK